MGGRSSRPVFPPLDPMFIPLGCMGMFRKEYDYPRLDLAPFLYYRIRVLSYSQLIEQILLLLRTLPPMDDERPPPPTTPADLGVARKRIHGPVYMFIAHDPEQGFIEAYLYFPNMTKDRKKWTSYHFLGVSHSWMYRLMYSPDYNILLPNTNCGRRLRDPRHTSDFERQRVAKETELREWREPPKSNLAEAPRRIAELEEELAGMSDVLKSMGMEIGCRTDLSYSCVQSKRAHKMMRLYRRRKPITQYPHIYFRMYQLNLGDLRLAKFVASNEFTHLRRDILPVGVDMFSGCRYMLISEDKKYFMVLSNSSLTIYWNYGDENLDWLCRFNRVPATSMAVRTIPFDGQAASRMLIEDKLMNIYSEFFEVESLVYSRQVIPDTAEGPFALVLQNNGTLVLFDSNNKIISSKGGLMSDRADGASLYGEYDPVEDYRRRILNLIAYLRLYRLYKEVEAQKQTLPKDVAMYILQEGIPPYDGALDYRERLENLAKYLIARGFKNIVVAAHTPDTTVQDKTAVTEPAKRSAERAERAERAKRSTDRTKRAKERKEGNVILTISDEVPPASTIWQTPGEIDPNAEADAEACAGLQDEALADCLDVAETAEVATELQAETNAQTSEYALINSTNMMDAAVTTGTTLPSDAAAADAAAKAKKNKAFTSEEYQKALGICRTSLRDNYMVDQDLYCRLITLKEYLRKRGYKIVEQDATGATDKKEHTIVHQIPDYNQPVDFATRLQATQSLFPKAQSKP